MFDIGFWELVTCALVALIVLGPERLPKAARIAGRLFAKLRKTIDDIKNDITAEVD